MFVVAGEKIYIHKTKTEAEARAWIKSDEPKKYAHIIGNLPLRVTSNRGKVKP